MASTSTPQWKYDVFLSFRGKDTRDGFTSHLYDALLRNQIITYIDYELGGGESIEPGLLEKIEQSNISVVIFSKNYANSTFCLAELSKILEWKETKGQIIIPIFYQVDPTDVQELRGRFGKALSRYERKCGSDLISEEEREGGLKEVHSWRRALTEIANLKGWDSNVTKPETKLLEEIVGDIHKKLNRMPPCHSKGSIGIDFQVKEVIKLLCIESSDVRVVGIGGMVGIGKTKVAEVVFDQISDRFEGTCFLPNIREEKKRRGECSLRNEILSKVLERRNLSIGTRTKAMLQRKKVLIVLDDVDSARDLKELVGEDGLLGPGSRIILTSRDYQVLENRCHKIYQMKKLEHHEALKLFSLNAFKQNRPPEEHMQLSEAVVHHAKGNPLVLSSLGYHLYRKDIRVWEDKFAKLKEDLDKDILEVFKMSYDDLEDTEKNAFLDIACFFGRCNKDLFLQTLHLRHFYAEWAMTRLIDRCFINISNKDIRVHELLQKVGRGIVCNESFDDPCKRSRLWDPDEIHRVLTHYQGPEEVQAISLDLSKIKEMTLSRKAFKRIQDKLRLLKFYYPRRFPRQCEIFHRLAVQMAQIKIHLPEDGLKYLSKDLRILRWDHYPYKSLPSNFCLGKLVELRMPCSHLEELVWNGFQPPVNLKILDLSYSVDLARVTDLSEVTNLEVLDLSSCGKLKNVPSSLEYCSKLTKIDLSHCENLRRFPKIPKNVEELSLRGTVIAKVPKSIGEHLCQLVKLDLSDCKCLRRLPSRIKNCKCLVELNLRRSQIVKLPDSISELYSLRYLDLEGCILSEIPDSIGSLKSLRKLNLTGNIFKNVPASIKQLSELTDLILNGCVTLQCLPELPLCLQRLNAQCCTSLESVQSIYTEVQKEYEASFEIFNFAYCSQLNEDAYCKIMGDAWLRIQRMATSLFNQGFQSGARFCVPGSEVPAWFNNQNTRGSSLQAIKTPHCNSTESLGCAFCVVVASKEESDHEDFAAIDEENFDASIGFDDIRCECQWITKNGHQSNPRFSYMLHKIDDVGKIGSNHAFVWYDSIPKPDHCFNEATFEFCLDYKPGTPKTCEVIKCGVHLLLPEDDDHEQPHPKKRLKKNIIDPDRPSSSCLTGQLNALDRFPLL